MALRTGVDRVRSESVHLTHGTVGVQKSAETRPKLSSEECRVRLSRLARSARLMCCQ